MSSSHTTTTTTASSRAAYAPSAPPVPDPNDEPQLAHPYNPQHHHQQQPSRTPPPPNYSEYPPYNHHPQTSSSTSSSQFGYGYGYGSSQPSYGHYHQQHQQYQPPPASLFPPGTDPEIIRSFQMVDRDQSGFIEEKELQQALTSAYHKFSLRTIRLLIFLFNTNPNHSSFTIGPKEFAALWSCLGQWRAIFERFDRDRSGKIDSAELRDALYSIGYAIPPSVLQVLLSRYDDGTGRRVELGFDTFVECGMIVKGLTEKFKEKDSRYTGSATLGYEEFLSMIIPFLAAD